MPFPERKTYDSIQQECLERLVDALRRRVSKGGKVATVRPRAMRKQLFEYITKQLKWTATLNIPLYNKFTQTYSRNNEPTIVVSHPCAIGIELGSKKPTASHIKRLSPFKGIRIIVLTNTGYYDPRTDRRGQFHKLTPEQIGMVDYLIGARADNLQLQSPDEIKRGFQLADFDPQLELEILNRIDAAWESRMPLSNHKNVRHLHDLRNINGERYLPKTLIEEFGVHPKAAMRGILQLKQDGIITHDQHSYYRMRGLRLTQKGAQRRQELSDKLSVQK